MRLRLAVVAAVLLGAASAHAQSTDFTYQGQLQQAGSPADGSFDFVFTLYSGASGGSASGSPVTASAVTVTGGLFATQLDFGANAFDSGDRYVEIQVRAAGSGSYSTLSPRQKVSPAPIALVALNNVNKAGDTMTGTLTLPVDGLAVGNGELSLNNGMLGIGVANPNYTVDIHGITDASIHLDDGNANSDSYYINSYNGTFAIGHAVSNGGSTMLYYSPAEDSMNILPNLYAESGMRVGLLKFTASYNLAGSYPSVSFLDTTNAAVTLTLPSASGVQGELMVVKHSAGASTATVAAPSGHTIDGAASITLALNASRTLVSDGTNWFIIGN